MSASHSRPSLNYPADRSTASSSAACGHFSWRSAAYLTAYALSRIVPKPVGFGIAALASAGAHALKRRERRGVQNNLSAVLGLSADSEPVRTAARQTYHRFGRSCVELLYETRSEITGPTLPNLEIVNLELLDRACSEGRGVILAAAHTGSWELGAMALASRGYPLTALAHPPAAGAAALYERHRARAGLQTLPIFGAGFRCVSVLRSGGILGIVADRRFGAAGRTANFFGRPTLLPQGAARLAVCAGAPVIGATLRLAKSPADRPILKFWSRLDPPCLRDPSESVQLLHQRLADLLESMIAESPEEWYCFEDLWRSADAGPNS